MNQTFGSDRKMILLSFVAAGTTVIAGILHLTMAPGSISRDPGQGILFLVGGIVQIFWAVPVIKRWGRIWQIIGIVGTAVFVILFFSSRLHLLPEGNILGGGPPGNLHPGEFPRGNMPRGIGFGLNGNSLLIEACQIAFIGLYAVQSKMISKRQKKKTDKKLFDKDEAKNKK